MTMCSTQWLAVPLLLLPALAVPPPYLTLRGPEPMIWYSSLGDWEEPGFTCTDAFEGELGPKYVSMSPTAQQFAKDAAQPGEHRIVYTCRNKMGLTATAQRIVNTASEPPKYATPILIMDGPSTLVFDLNALGKRAQNEAFKKWFPDPGVDCYDPHRGKVFVTSHVPDDIHKAGQHAVTYKCSTGQGLSSVVTRDVVTVNKKPVIELRGENPSYFRPPTTTPSQYIDAGASCFDTDGKDISNSVVSAIPDMRIARGTSKPVVRTVKYTCINKMGVSATPVSRTVYVEVSHTASPPNIVLEGDPTMILPYDASSFTDPGASCFDKEEGRIRNIISDIPDLAVKGRHAVVYTCKNSRGGVATAQRLVYSGYRASELPKITLKGPKVIHTRACDIEYDDDCAYTDPGSVCTDAKGNPVENVDVMIPDMTTPGITYVEYSCKDNDGMPAPDVKRKVVVSITPPPGAPILSLHGPALRHVQPCSHDCSTVWSAIAKDVTCKDDNGKHLKVDYTEPDISRPRTLHLKFGCIDDKDESAMPISIKLVVHEDPISHDNVRAQTKQFEPVVEPVESENSKKATNLSWLNLLASGPAAPMLVVAAVAFLATCFSSQSAMKGRRLHPRHDSRREDGDEHENEGLVAGDRRTTAEVLDRPNSRSNMRRRSSAPQDIDSDEE